MTGLAISGVTKKFGNITAVEDVNLTFKDGEMVCFLGPSGCGKTTLLRMIAGLEEPTSGSITMGGRDMTHVPVHQREIGMVFQSFALFPHLTVGENITYSMRIRGHSRSEREDRARELLDMMHLPGMADRRISQLSGGQRQRVAIARALALNPQVFLLDEPMSALDANLREAMQIELRKLQQELGITTVVVTHDQTEAMTMADTIVVMGKAKVLQSGSPMEIYKKPVDRFVADFIGTSNLLPARMSGEGTAEVSGTSLNIGTNAHGFAKGDEVVLMTRPEEVFVRPASAERPANAVTGRVTFVRDIGATIEILCDCDGHEVISVLTPKDWPEVEIGQEVHIEMPKDACSVLAP
ncbi:putative spermidine/putrescine transport system ATP-binding protein [Roseovarius nanhaiticus]|uniref:Putative spermidine/putrescine transport system ATP-binding protein n=1 Tax=Roseovarius nanhaiticus TaxID=573024 RepID=A0A1N7F8D0_9RHOB|nr:ABC transporter ATP-binding protein [Roseovarius nanhaiticus]SEK59791.1 putative spermidine/putrescine transport system ATP-binding protein [Roseovarius nanhaiticus]SIR96475.1 putative spermidine/putrescine transport system ATP-binding protein [Roseovarius nanhaiticus]